MNFNKLLEYRAKIRDRMDNLLDDNNFELNAKYLDTIHEELFRGILINSGRYRHYNLSREEEILNLDTVSYHDFHTIPAYLNFAFRNQNKLDYSKMNMDEVIDNISSFVSELWLIHPFSDGNTRAVGLFVEKYLKHLGYVVNHDIFKSNAKYFRDALVRATYSNEELNILPNYDALINFYNKVLVDSEIELNQEFLYIPELFQKEVKSRKKLFGK